MLLTHLFDRYPRPSVIISYLTVGVVIHGDVLTKCQVQEHDINLHVSGMPLGIVHKLGQVGSVRTGSRWEKSWSARENQSVFIVLNSLSIKSTL